MADKEVCSKRHQGDDELHDKYGGGIKKPSGKQKKKGKNKAKGKESRGPEREGDPPSVSHSSHETEPSSSAAANPPNKWSFVAHPQQPNAHATPDEPQKEFYHQQRNRSKSPRGSHQGSDYYEEKNIDMSPGQQHNQQRNRSHSPRGPRWNSPRHQGETRSQYHYDHYDHQSTWSRDRSKSPRGYGQHFGGHDGYNSSWNSQSSERWPRGRRFDQDGNNRRGRDRSPMRCWHCQSLDHMSRDCTFCKACKIDGHYYKSKSCPAVVEEPLTNLRCIKGKDDILSNFYTCTVSVYGREFNSSENAYHYKKAMLCDAKDIAERFVNARDAAAGKEISRELKNRLVPDWDNQRNIVMRDVLLKKLEQVQIFRDELMHTQDKILVHTLTDMYWGSGLQRDDTEITKPEYWPGQNMHGVMLEELRCENLDIEKTEQNSCPQRKPDTLRSCSTSANTSDPNQTAVSTDHQSYGCPPGFQTNSPAEKRHLSAPQSSENQSQDHTQHGARSSDKRQRPQERRQVFIKEEADNQPNVQRNCPDVPDTETWELYDDMDKNTHSDKTKTESVQETYKKNSPDFPVNDSWDENILDEQTSCETRTLSIHDGSKIAVSSSEGNKNSDVQSNAQCASTDPHTCTDVAKESDYSQSAEPQDDERAEDIQMDTETTCDTPQRGPNRKNHRLQGSGVSPPIKINRTGQHEARPGQSGEYQKVAYKSRKHQEEYGAAAPEDISTDQSLSSNKHTQKGNTQTGRSYDQDNRRSDMPDNKSYSQSSRNQRGAGRPSHNREQQYYEPPAKNIIYKEKLSRFLTSVLRHSAQDMKLTILEGGYVRVADILQCKDTPHKFRNATLKDIQEVVATNDKKRLDLQQDADGQWKIRANQGHTMNVDIDMPAITDPKQFPLVVHGTYYSCLKPIRDQGLSKMDRQHVHFAPGEPGKDEVISGMRGSCQVIISIDLAKALNDGIKFYLSTNNVILSPGDKDGFLSPEYFKSIIDRNTRKVIQ